MKFIGVVRAQFDYEAQDRDELAFREADILCLLGQEEGDSDWLRACLLKDQTKVGVIPSNYIMPMEPMAKITALYGYEAQEDNEVAFGEGEQMDLLATLEDDWWLVRKGGIQYGMVPSNYFDPLDDAKQEDAQVDGEPVRMIDEGQQLKWIDTVDVRCAFPGKLIFSKSDKRKGEVVIGEDGALGFVVGDEKNQILKLDLTGVSSYDKKKKQLVMKGGFDIVNLDLAKGHAEQLQKEIRLAHEKAEREALEWEQAQMAAYAGEASPSLPPRAATPVMDSPVGQSLAQVLTGKTSPIINKQDEQFVLALYDFEPNEEDELKIVENEKLLLLDGSTEDWWLVQRLNGSQKKGLVPSSYVQRDYGQGKPLSPYEQLYGAQTDEPEEEDDSRELIKPKSPTSPYARPESPLTSPAFLEEVKAKIRSRSPAPIPLEEEPSVAPTSPLAEQVEVQLEEEEEALVPPPPPPMPVAFQHEAQSDEEEEVPAPPPMPAAFKHSAEPIPIEGEVEPAPAPAAPLMPQAIHRQPSIKTAEVPVESYLRAEAPVGEVVKAEPKKVEQTVKLPATKLKPVMKDEKGFNAISNMLLRKQEDIKTGHIVRAESPRPMAVKEEDKPAQNANPWSSLSMKSVSAPKPEMLTVKSVLPKPSLPSQTRSPPSQPLPAESRMWTSRNGQYQIEAKYLSYQAGKVTLHKLNGSKVTVALEHLGERDKEFVYRREGIPWDQGPKKDFRVGAHDWLAFFMDAGLDATRARVYAQACLDRRIGETFLLSTNFSRSFLLSSLNMSESDVLEVLRYTGLVKDKLAKNEITRRNLEKIEQLKRDIAGKAAPPPPPPAQRRPSEAFAGLDMLQSFMLQPQPAMQPVMQPVMQPQQQTRAPAPGIPQYLAPRSVKDIPSMQPLPKNGGTPTMFSSTTVLNVPGAPAGQGYPQQRPVQPQGHPQQLQYQQQQQSYPQQQQQSNPHQQPQAYAQPYQQQQVYRSGVLPNLSAPQPYVQPPALPSQQRFHTMHHQAYPVMGTTQVRTEYYGYNGQAPPQPGQPPMMMATPQYGPVPVQPMKGMQGMTASMQNLHLQAPAQQPHSSSGIGDKYSIFRYVDPKAPQLLPPSHQQQPPSNQQQYGGNYQHIS